MIPSGGMLDNVGLCQKSNDSFMQAVGFSLPGQSFAVRFLDLEVGIN